MSNEVDGGPAFPQLSVSAPPEQQGMSLRDWFAGRALAGSDCDSYSPASTAECAYRVADAMLEERKNND